MPAQISKTPLHSAKKKTGTSPRKLPSRQEAWTNINFWDIPYTLVEEAFVSPATVESTSERQPAGH